MPAVSARTSPLRSAAALPAVVPMAGETQSQFFLRADRALRKSVPAVNRRTLEILRLWRAAPNDRDLQDKAAAMFPSPKFQRYGPRCIFLEHTIPADADVSRPEIRYGQAELQQLVEWANYRIRNSDNFAAISDGHTPSQTERDAGASMPEVLGYAGPFYLGRLGDLDPVWAIYADEWIHADAVPRFEKLQRRSPEVWAIEPMERRTLDPIAALGAETPRLDCGMNAYARAGDGQVVMRYSAATAAVSVLPGSHNVSPPSAGRWRNHRYSGDSPMPPLPGQDTDLSTQIGEAIQAVLPTLVQAVAERLQAADNPPPDDELDSPANRPPRGMEPDPANDEPDDLPAEPDEPEDDDPEARRYRAMGSNCYQAYQAGRRRGAIRYSRSSESGLSVIVARQARELERLRSDIERERRDVVRYQRLTDLARDFAFDPREEFETVQDLTDPQFERHCKVTVVKYARRDDITGLELPDDLEPERYSRSGGTRVDPKLVERYSREAATRAARKNAAQRGATTFEAEFDAICREHGITV